MVILHVGNVRNRPQSGVAVVVPKHIQHQATFAEVGLLNLDDFLPEGGNDSYPVFQYVKNMSISDLPDGFSRPDIVIFHEVYWFAFISLSKELIKIGIPYIIVPHVSLTDTAQKSKKIKKFVGNLLYFRKFIDNSAAIQFLSLSEKTQTTHFSNINSFIQSNAIDFKGKLKNDFSSNGLALVYIGRMATHVKGIDRLLNVARILKKRGVQDVHISLYGPDHANNKIKIKQEIIDDGLDSIVTLHDALFGDDKLRTMLENDCFIQLSRTEGQPLGIMEAMEIGMPCIVTSGTTFYDVVRDNRAGIAVSDNPENIADSIEAIALNKSDLKFLSLNASNYIHEYYDWKKVASNTVQSYIDILKEIK